MGILNGINDDFTRVNHCLMEVELPDNNEKENSLMAGWAINDCQPKD